MRQVCYVATYPVGVVADDPAPEPVKPQTWLGIQQLQRKPSRARKPQQLLMELPLPRSASLAQQVQRAPRTAHHSDDTVEDNCGAASARQTILVQQQLQTTVVVRADVQLLQPFPAHENVQPQQAPELEKGAPAVTSLSAAAGLHAKHLAASKADLVPCTPVAAAAHLMQPLSQCTRSKPTQAPQPDAPAQDSDTASEKPGGLPTGGRCAHTLGPQAGPSAQQHAQAGQPMQQGTADEAAPQHKADSGFDVYDFDANLAQTDDQVAAAAKGRHLRLPQAQIPADRSTADRPVAASTYPEVRLLSSSSAAAAAAAAAVHSRLPKQAPPEQTGSPGVFGLSPTPHKAFHWRGQKPSAAAEPMAAGPADSGCPSGLAYDPSTAFAGLEGLVQAVQGDQQQQQSDHLLEAEHEGTPAAAAADANAGMGDAPGVLQSLCIMNHPNHTTKGYIESALTLSTGTFKMFFCCVPGADKQHQMPCVIVRPCLLQEASMSVKRPLLT